MAEKPRILCVDDKADGLLIRKAMLEVFGCEVTAVGNSGSCLEVLEQKAIDLVIIDYHLGESRSGEDLARTIRASRPALPLLMLTGDPNIPASARESVDAVLIKGSSSPANLLDLIEEFVPDSSLQPRRAPIYRDSYKAC